MSPAPSGCSDSFMVPSGDPPACYTLHTLFTATVRAKMAPSICRSHTMVTDKGILAPPSGTRRPATSVSEAGLCCERKRRRNAHSGSRRTRKRVGRKTDWVNLMHWEAAIAGRGATRCMLLWRKVRPGSKAPTLESNYATFGAAMAK